MTRQDLEKRCEELAHVYAIERHQHRQHPQYGFTAMTFREAFTAALNLTWPMVEERDTLCAQLDIAKAALDKVRPLLEAYNEGPWLKARNTIDKVLNDLAAETKT